MYYHIQVSSHDNSQITSLDNPNLEDVKEKVLGYLLGKDFYLGGSLVRANNVKTLIVTQSKDKSDECVTLAYSKMPVGSNHVILPEACVFGNDRFSEDITSSIIAEMKADPRILRRQTSIEIWTVGELPKQIKNLRSTVTALYITVKDLLEKETERRYRRFRIKVFLIGLINYGLFIYFLLNFDFHKIVHPVIIFIEITFHFVAIYFLLFGREYEPRELLKAKKEKIRQQVYDESDFEELDIREKLEQISGL